MKTVRVSRGIMNSLYDMRYAYGKKYVYTVRSKVSSGCFIVERYPRYYYHYGVGEGRRLCTLDYARRNGMIEVLQVKENNHDSLHPQDKQFEQVENFLLSHPDEEYKTARFVYYFKIVGDCAGIFRRATETCTRKGRKIGDEEIVAYYHEGEF